jgi:hypothetical protein
MHNSSKARTRCRDDLLQTVVVTATLRSRWRMPLATRLRDGPLGVAERARDRTAVDRVCASALGLRGLDRGRRLSRVGKRETAGVVAKPAGSGP